MLCLPKSIRRGFLAAAVSFACGSAALAADGMVAHNATAVGTTDGAGLTIGVIAPRISQAKLEFLVSEGELSAAVASAVLHVYDDTASYSPLSSFIDDGEDSDVALDVLQVLSDYAPAASLVFIAPPPVDTDPNDGIDGPANAAAAFISAQQALVVAGVDVIVDAFPAIDQSPFYEGDVAQATKTVAESITYITAIGDEGSYVSSDLYLSNNVYEGAFNPVEPAAGLLGAGYEYVERIQRFGENLDELTITAEQGLSELCLYWADEPGASVNDFELFVLDAAGAIVASSTNFQYAGGAQAAEECISVDLASITLENPSPLQKNNRIVVGTDAIYTGYSSTEADGPNYRYLHVRGTPADASASEPVFDVTTGSSVRGRAALSNVTAVGSAPVPTELQNSVTVDRAFTEGDAVVTAVPKSSSVGLRPVFYEYNGSAHVLAASDGGTLNALTITDPRNRVKPDVAGAERVSVVRASGIPGSYTAAGAEVYGTAVAAANIGGLVARTAQATLIPSEMREALILGTVDLGLAMEDGLSGYGAPVADQVLASLAKPMDPVSALVTMIGVSTARLTFVTSPDDPGTFRYDVACSQTNGASTVELTPVEDWTSGDTFTVTPGWTPSCSVLAYDPASGEQSAEISATYDDEGSVDTTPQKPVLGEVRNEAEGFSVTYTVDAGLPANSYSGLLSCSAGGNVVVDKVVAVSVPNATASAYDLEAGVVVDCSLEVSATVNSQAVPAASDTLTFQATPEEAIPAGLPVWLLYEASKAERTPAQ